MKRVRADVSFDSSYEQADPKFLTHEDSFGDYELDGEDIIFEPGNILLYDDTAMNDAPPNAPRSARGAFVGYSGGNVEDDYNDTVKFRGRKFPSMYGKRYGSIRYARDARGRPMTESNDGNYVDVAFQDDVPEDGVVTRTLLDIEMNDTGLYRTGKKIIVKKIEIRGEFVLQTGNKLVARLIIFRDKQPTQSVHTPLSGSSYLRTNTRKVTDILAKSPITLTKNVQEGDVPDLLKGPNNYCFSQFELTNSFGSQKIVHMWDQYYEMHTRCFSGEDTVAVPDSRYFKIVLDDLDIPVTYSSEHGNSINMNNISFMWIGDYQGGTCIGTIFFRIHYVNTLN